MVESNPMKQLNVRLDDEMLAILAELGPLASRATGIKVSKSNLVRLGLRALTREYRSRDGHENNSQNPASTP